MVALKTRRVAEKLEGLSVDKMENVMQLREAGEGTTQVVAVFIFVFVLVAAPPWRRSGHRKCRECDSGMVHHSSRQSFESRVCAAAPAPAPSSVGVGQTRRVCRAKR